MHLFFIINLAKYLTTLFVLYTSCDTEKRQATPSYRQSPNSGHRSSPDSVRLLRAYFPRRSSRDPIFRSPKSWPPTEMRHPLKKFWKYSCRNYSKLHPSCASFPMAFSPIGLKMTCTLFFASIWAISSLASLAEIATPVVILNH